MAIVRTLVVFALIFQACGPTGEDRSERKSRRDLGVVLDEPPLPNVQGTSVDHTPGFFRDMYRILDATSVLDVGLAADRLRVELEHRAYDPGELPDLLPVTQNTLEALLAIALRTMQSTADQPQSAYAVGSELVRITLGLDPALAALTEESPTEAGAATVAAAALFALDTSSSSSPALCRMDNFSSASFWNLGAPVVVWVDEVCQQDRWVGGYCEPDRYIDGQCYQTWVPEDCTGGYWRDNGYYDYVCYSYDDCRTIWRSRWVYIDGHCTGGYYDEYCNNGYWEYGLCYDGTYVPGYCRPGHYEYRYPGGTWTFHYYVTAPQECEGVRPAQFSVATRSIQAISSFPFEDVDPEWQAAIDAWLDEAQLDEPNEPALESALQILQAIAE
jgi:hypothetical protein